MSQHEVELSSGTIVCHDEGSGPPVVLVHGALVDHRLWDGVAAELVDTHRVIRPVLPLGAHRTPMRPDADLSPPGAAALINELLEVLYLEDVTLVGNDTGGALCQILVTTDPSRVGSLALVSCDAFDTFPPKEFAYLKWLARIPGGTWEMTQVMRSARLRRMNIGLGGLTVEPMPDELTASWVEPARVDRGVRRDLRKLILGIHKRHTLAAAETLDRFDRPALVAWGRQDKYFPAADAERLAELLPQGELAWVDDAATFVPLDQPKKLAGLLAELATRVQPGSAGRAERRLRSAVASDAEGRE